MPTFAKKLYWDARKQIDIAKSRRHLSQLLQRVRTTVELSGSPDCAAAERDFDSLQLSYSGPGEYGYGFIPNWQRGVERSLQLVAKAGALTPESRALEVACGDGMTSVMLAALGLRVETTDLKDWRDPRAQHLPFQPCDLGSQDAFPEGPFDLVFSYNAFEHFPDPSVALGLMVRATKPGGCLFFEFGPLFAGPWGLHAYRMLRMPYPQFLFSEAFWKAKIQVLGVQDLGQSLDDLQPLNRWTVRQFEALWAASGCEIVHQERYRQSAHLDLVQRYPQSFQGRGLTEEDLTTQGLCVLLRKPA